MNECQYKHCLDWTIITTCSILFHLNFCPLSISKRYKSGYSPDYCTQEGSHSNMKEKSKALQTSTSWENSHHQTSSPTNAKGSSLDRKHKKQILKAAREKQQITHKGIPYGITADLSIETLQARREWQDILKVMKENNLQPRLLYPARISFKYGEIKSFTDKQKLREFCTTKPALQQILKDIL